MYEEDDFGSTEEGQTYEDDAGTHKSFVKPNKTSFADLMVSELVEFKQLVDEIYGDEVFQKRAESELADLFWKKPPVC